MRNDHPELIDAGLRDGYNGRMSTLSHTVEKPLLPRASASTFLLVPLIAGTYLLAARLGLLLAFEFKNVSPVWPPSGIAIAALLLFGTRVWPAVAIGAFLANLTTGLPFLTSGFICFGNTLEAVLASQLLLRAGSFRTSLARFSDVALLAVAAIASSAVAATIGAAALAVSTPFLQWEGYPRAWLTWWFGDTMGALVVGSLVMVWASWLKGVRSARRNLSARQTILRAVEAVAMVSVLFSIAYFVFWRFAAYPYTTFPVLIWAAIRFGQRGAVSAVAVVASLSIWATVNYHGPFARPDVQTSLLYLQTYVAIVSFTSLILGAAIAERAEIERALSESEHRFRLALENSNVIVYAQDRELRYTWIYDGKHDFDPRAIIGKSDEDLASPDEAAALCRIKRRVMETGVGEHAEILATTGRGQRTYDLVVEPLHAEDGSIIGVNGAAHDITEIKRYEADVLALNERLRRAMRETHHRVKNNLQIISAMVDMRLMDSQDHVPAEEMRRLASITTTLATVHDLLTHEARDGGANLLSTRDIIRKLVSMLQATAPSRPLESDVDEMLIPSKQATSLAIVVSELVGNGLKHGKGAVRIKCRKTAEGALLEVSDEGSGFPKSFDLAESSGTGLELVEALSRMDLAGSLDYSNLEDGGACVVVRMQISPSLAVPVAEPAVAS